MRRIRLRRANTTPPPGDLPNARKPQAASEGAISERATPAPGDRIRRKGTELDPAASGLFERWDNERGWLAVVHWDNQPFHVYDRVALGELEIEPTDDGS